VFQVDLARALFAVLPGALLWGASFPLALAAASEGASADAGQTVGRVYGGEYPGGHRGLADHRTRVDPWIGTKGAEQVFIVVSAVSGVVVMLPLLRRPAIAATSCALAVVAVLSPHRCRPCPWDSLAWGAIAVVAGTPHALTWGEGMNASIAVTEETGGYRNFMSAARSKPAPSRRTCGCSGCWVTSPR